MLSYKVLGVTIPSLLLLLGIVGTSVSATAALDYHVYNSDHQCVNSYSPAVHIARFTDRANHTIDIWCKKTETMPIGEKQYIGYYDGGVVVGVCPFDNGQNIFSIMTDEHGIINATHWESRTSDGKSSVMFDLKFNNIIRPSQ